MATNYSRGAEFERRIGHDIDGEVVAIQCKRDGRLAPQEWNKFLDWCEAAGATPVLASKGPRGSGIIYSRLTSRKDGRGRQPLESWTPQREGKQDEVS